MKSSKFNVQTSKNPVSDFSLRTPNSELRTQNSGFTYIALLAAIVILGILMGAAGKYWQTVMLREKEEELLFRGEQYRLAIARYYNAKPGVHAYPPNLEALLSDGRFPQARRHLRRQYKDPITGEDFEIIMAQSLTAVSVPAQTRPLAGVIGVCSRSEKEPLKQVGFPEQYKDFEGKKKYNEWKFIFTLQQAGHPSAPPAPGMAPVQPH